MQHVDLARQFRDLTPSELADPELLLALSDARLHDGFGWDELLQSPRVLILAEAGSGKTAEMREQARRLRTSGKPAFFVPLEALSQDALADILFGDDRAAFEAWKADDTAIAWFFLDAVDELKLSQGRFDQALRRVAKATDGLLHRVRVIVSCRPSDWRPSVDLATLRATLPLQLVSNQQTSPEDVFLSALQPRVQDEPAAADLDSKIVDVRVVVLFPMNRGQIEQLATALGIADAAAFLEELRRQDAWSFARRPLDLSELVLTWKAQGRLGTRADQHEANVVSKLKDDPGRPDRGLVSNDRLRHGAERLALALGLVRARTLRAPEQAIDVGYTQGVLDAASILTDWSESERQALLRRGLFDPATYGRVRFHHRSVQEYLAACCLSRLREKGMSVRAVFRLLFAERYGARVVVPSMRPIASWLALSDRHVRRELISREPETLLAMGDPESLPLDLRRELLRAFAAAYGTGGWRGLRIPVDEVRRLAHPELADVVRELWGTGPTNDDVRELLLEVIEQGKIDQCADLAALAARDTSYPDHHRLIAARAVIACADHQSAEGIGRSVANKDAAWSDELVANLVDELFPVYLSTSELLGQLKRVTSSGARTTFAQAMRRIGMVLDPQSSVADDFRDGVADLISKFRDDDKTAFRFSGTYDDAAPALAELCLRQMESSARPVDSRLVQASVIANRFGGDTTLGRDPFSRLRSAFRADLALREQVFWCELALVDGVIPGHQDAWLRLRRALHGSLLEHFNEEDRGWLIAAVRDESMPARRGVALEAVLDLWVRKGRNEDELTHILTLVLHVPELVAIVNGWTTPPRRDPDLEEMEREHEQYRSRAAERERQRVHDWKVWRDGLVAEPAAAFAPEQRLHTMSLMHRWLESRRDVSGYSAWDAGALTMAFGADVAARAAEAFRNLWRSESALLWSVRPKAERNTIQGTWIYGLNGVGAESQTGADWATRLTSDEARRAAAFATIEVIGFPTWLADLSAARPTEVEDVLGAELSAQLELAAHEQHLPLLQATAHADERVRRLLAPRVLKVLSASWPETSENATVHLQHHLDNALQILHKSDINSETLSDLLERRYTADATGPLSVAWLRGLFKSSPRCALNAFQSTLAGLAPAPRDDYALAVFAEVFGSHGGFTLGTRDEAERAQILGDLVRCAYTYVRPADDQQHEGAYTPNPRDEAERARNYLIGALLETEGYEAQRIILELAGDPLVTQSPDRLRMLARERAAKDAEPPAIVSADVVALERRFELPPSDRDGLFETMMDRLDDLEQDILHHDFTDRRTLRLIADESEMQRTLALRLESSARGAYLVTRESEVADAKRTDIRLAAVHRDQKTTIEVKIADGRWSVIDLEKALRDQLVGRYLRHDTSRSGCLLLTYDGTKNYWEHPQTGNRMGFDETIAHLASVAETVVSQLGHTIRLSVRGLDLRDPKVP